MVSFFEYKLFFRAVFCKEQFQGVVKTFLFCNFYFCPKVKNCHFGSKIKSAKQDPKNVSTTYCSCSMQKTAPK